MHVDQLYQSITESFNNGYPWEHSTKTQRSEKYFIDLPDGHELAVMIVKTPKYDKPEVEFTSTDFNPDDVFAMTGNLVDKGINPIRAFSSLIQIMKQSPLIKVSGGFIMFANKSEVSRVALYKRMLSKFGYRYTNFDDSRSMGFNVDV